MKRFLGLALLLAWLPAHADLEGLRTAAQAGDANAQLELGQLYEFGFGLKENAVPAMAWYLTASRNGSARAGERAAVLRPKLSAAQHQEAERLSQEWAPTTRRVATPAAPASPTPAQTPAPTAPKPEAASTPATAPAAPAPTKAAPKLSPPPAKPAQADPASARPSPPSGSTPAPEKPAPAPKPAEDDKLGPG